MDKYLDPSTRRFRRNTDNHISPEFEGVDWNKLTSIKNVDCDRNSSLSKEYNARLDYAIEQSKLFKLYDRELFKREQEEFRKKFNRNTRLVNSLICVIGVSVTVLVVSWVLNYLT